MQFNEFQLEIHHKNPKANMMSTLSPLLASDAPSSDQVGIMITFGF